jgi:hypothetical protein
MNSREVAFFPGDLPLNEFGLSYVGLFIAGSFARYYQDFWIREIESAHALASAIEHFVQAASRRMVILCFSELSECLWTEHVSF